MAFLLSEQSVTANGQSSAVALADLAPSPALAAQLPGHLQLTLGILAAEEQQSLELFVEASADGQTWQPLASFPQKFHAGSWALTPPAPAAAFLRARWVVNRWGRGSLVPHFRLYLFAERAA